ncbi:MAG: hypothetical protein ACI35P_15670 [Bacillus sp. (in: firmicutes)]
MSLKQMKNAFLKRLSHRNKKILSAQLLLVFFAAFVCFQAQHTIGTSAYETYSVLLKITVGLIALLTGIEYHQVHKGAKRNYAVWFILASVWFGMVIDQLFFWN